jgi:hypothetical protein
MINMQILHWSQRGLHQRSWYSSGEVVVFVAQVVVQQSTIKRKGMRAQMRHRLDLET